MSVTDPIADMLTRVRNALRVHRKTVDVNLSNVNRGIAAVLVQEGYVERFEAAESEGGVRGMLRIFLKYGPDAEQVIQKITRVSKPGCRVYKGIKDVDAVLDGLGITILSTSKGVMSDREARQQNIGGEVICTVS